MVEIKFVFLGKPDSQLSFLKADIPPDDYTTIRRVGEEARYPAYSFSHTPISPNPKWTEGMQRCVGILVGGTTRSGENLSLLTHATPGAFNKEEEKFRRKYPGLLAELALQTLPHSRYAIIAEGADLGFWENIGLDMFPGDSRKYPNVIRALERIHRKVFCESTLVLPAKKGWGETGMYFTDQRLYVVEQQL